VCREKLYGVNLGDTTAGSPLRVQGKVRYCATMQGDEDHPCVCREKIKGECKMMELIGSPLRVQGKAERSRKNEEDHRITPACAGKSLILLIVARVF